MERLRARVGEAPRDLVIVRAAGARRNDEERVGEPRLGGETVPSCERRDGGALPELEARPERGDLPAEINEHLVVELYSK